MATDQDLYSPARRRWAVVLASVASFMVGLDVLVTMTALPTLHVELGAGAAGLAWTINAYEIGFAALILTGTALGDRCGRRLLFLIGVGVFTAGSVWCALSSSVGHLIAARAFQGVGGGVATALALAVISAATPPERRGAAFGVWGAVTGVAVAVGPVVGGAIIHSLAWQWIFWLNVPVGVALIGLSLSRIADTRGDVTRIDVLGLVLSTVGVIAVAQALIRAGDIGWSAPPTLLGFVGGALALVAFTVWQHRSRTPMMPLAMFRNRSFSGGCGASFALGAGLYGNAFMFAQYLQLALGHDPLAVGIRLLPWVALAPLVSPVAGLLADLIGERPLVISGLGLFTAAFSAIGPLATADAGYTTLIGPLVVAGIGVATAFPTIATAVMRSADPTRLGVASGVSNTMRQVGAVFGVAVAVAVFSTFGGYGSPQQFVDGFGPTVMVLAAITLAGLVPAAVIRPRRGRPVRHPREEAYETA
jgi:EmrB/QacA subfamily drug resistance transporter